MALFDNDGWGRKALPWVVLFVVQLGMARAFELSADKIVAAFEEPATLAVPQEHCVDMGRRFDMNVLAAMTTEELEYLQAGLCPTQAS